MHAREFGRFALAAVLFVAFVFPIVALLQGAPCLTYPVGVLAGLPAGNLVSALSPIAGSLLGVVAAPGPSVRRRAALALTLLSLTWLPVSIALAGNVYLDFRGGVPWHAWLVYTGALNGAVLALLLWSALAAGYRVLRRGALRPPPPG